MNTSERRNQPTETIVTCVYCGMAYPQGTPTHGAIVLTEHIKTCEKHPMRELARQLTAAETALSAEAKKREQAEADAKHFESLYRAAKVEVNFKDSECDRLQEEIEALKVSNSIDAAGNEQFQKAFERAEQAEASCAAMRKTLTDIAHATFRGEKSPESICAAICLNNLDSAGAALLAELQRYREALEVLSRLGNGDRLGNSDGNRIAQAALSASSSAQRVQAAGEQGAPFDEPVYNPDTKGGPK